jgi:hypothetical protein
MFLGALDSHAFFTRLVDADPPFAINRVADVIALLVPE